MKTQMADGKCTWCRHNLLHVGNNHVNQVQGWFQVQLISYFPFSIAHLASQLFSASPSCRIYVDHYPEIPPLCKTLAKKATFPSLSRPDKGTSIFPDFPNFVKTTHPAYSPLCFRCSCWAGHITRMGYICMPKAVFFSKLQEGKCDYGAPKKPYKDRLKLSLIHI